MHVHYNVRSIWICLLLQCLFAVFWSWTYLYTQSYHCILGQHMPCSLLQGYQRTLMFLSSLKWLRYVISLLILRGIRFIIFILQVMMTVIIIKYYFKIVSLELQLHESSPEWNGKGWEDYLPLRIWCITVLNGAFYP